MRIALSYSIEPPAFLPLGALLYWLSELFEASLENNEEHIKK